MFRLTEAEEIADARAESLFDLFAGEGYSEPDEERYVSEADYEASTRDNVRRHATHRTSPSLRDSHTWDLMVSMLS